MERKELPDDVALDLLHDEAATLEENIHDLDLRIARAVHGHAEGIATQRNIVPDIHILHEAKHTLMFKLGRVSAHIDELEGRMVDRDLSSPDLSARGGATPEVAHGENLLDWLDLKEVEPNPPSEGGEWHEPDHDRR